MTGIDRLMSESEAPVVIADQRGIITHVNAAFGKTFHWKKEDLIGQGLVVLIPRNLQ